MKIKVKVGGKKLKLTVEEAKELHKELCELFPQEKEIVYVDRYYPWWNWQPFTVTSDSTTVTSSDGTEWTSYDLSNSSGSHVYQNAIGD